MLKSSDYGCVNDGLSKHVEWQQALDAAAASGDLLVVDKPFSIFLTPGGSEGAFIQPVLNDPPKIHISSHAEISCDYRSMVLRIRRTPQAEACVTACETVRWPTSPDKPGNNYVTKLVVDPTENVSYFKAGRTVMVCSDDLYKMDSAATDDVPGTRKAQLVEVMEVDAVRKFIYLREVLYEKFGDSKTIKVAMLRESDVNIDLRVSTLSDVSNQDLSVPNEVRDLVVEDFGVGSSITLHSRVMFGGGIGLMSCFRGRYAVYGVKRVRNCPGKGSYPYGINVSGASRYLHLTVMGAGFRHAVTNTMRGSSELRKRGRQADITCTGEAWNSTSAAWDAHPGALRWTFDNCRARYSSLDFNAVTAGQTGTQVGFQDRGEETTFVNPFYDGNGLMFIMKSKLYHYGNYVTTIINPISRKISDYALPDFDNAWMSFQGIDPDNTDKQMVCVLGGFVRDQEKLVDVYNCGKNISITLGGGLRLQNVDDIFVGGEGGRRVELTLDGVVRYIYSNVVLDSNNKKIYKYFKGIRAKGEADINIHDYTVHLAGGAAMNSLVYFDDPAGSVSAATLKIGSVKVDGEIGFFYCKGNENVTLPEIKWVAPNVLQGKESFSLPVLQAGQSSTTTVTVVGVSAGFDNYCSVVPAFSVDLNGLMMSAYVSAANTVTVRFVNPTSSSVGPLTGVLRATVQV